MRLTAARWLCLIPALLTACGDGGPSTDSLVTARDSAGGILRIRHVGPAPGWTPEVRLTIGTVEEGPASFGRIRALLLARDGGVLVADAGNRAIKEFGPDGAWRRIIGRDGSGPAEYQQPYSLGWLGDTLLVLDPQNARLGLFAPDGSWAGQRPSALLTGGRHVRLYPSGDGRLYQIGVVRIEGSPIAGRVFIGHGASGITDSMAALPNTTNPDNAVVCTWPDNGGMTFFEVPFTPRQLLVPGPGGTQIVAESGRYLLAWLRPDGDTVRVLERDFAPVPITDLEWAERTREFRETREKQPQLACPVSTLPRPPAKPALDDFFLADDGTLWVDRWTVGGLVTEVFSPEGDLLGSFPALPREREIDPSMRGNRIAVVESDADGVPFVKVYEVRR